MRQKLLPKPNDGDTYQEPSHDEHKDDDTNDNDSNDSGRDSKDEDDEPPKPNDGGMLEIEHPAGEVRHDEHHDERSEDRYKESRQDSYQANTTPKYVEESKTSEPDDLAHMTQPFAHEGDDFEISQPEPESSQRRGQPSFNQPLPGQYPAIVLPDAPAEATYAAPRDEPTDAQINALSNDSTNVAVNALANEQSDEAAALDLIKEHKIKLDSRAKIQPLRDQGEFMAEPPAVDPDILTPGAEIGEQPSGQSEDSKYALEPPTMSGTLTANSTPEHFDPMAGGPKSEAQTPLLKHFKQGSTAPAVSASALDDEQDTPKKQEVPKRAEPLIAPAFEQAHVTVSNPAESTVPATVDHQTLADIERSIHSSHVTAAAVAATPTPAPAVPSTPVSDGVQPALQAALYDGPSEALDMPKPSVPLPSAQTNQSNSGPGPALEAAPAAPEHKEAKTEVKPANTAASAATPPPPVPPPILQAVI